MKLCNDLIFFFSSILVIDGSVHSAAKVCAHAYAYMHPGLFAYNAVRSIRIYFFYFLFFNIYSHLPCGTFFLGTVADHHVSAFPSVPLHHPVETRFFRRPADRRARSDRRPRTAARFTATRRRTAAATGGRINVFHGEMRPEPVQQQLGQRGDQMRRGDQHVDAVGPVTRI